MLWVVSFLVVHALLQIPIIFALDFYCYAFSGGDNRKFFLFTLDNFLYFISFLLHLFIKRCRVQSKFIHIFYSTFYAAFMCSYWLWMIQCYFIFLTIVLMTYPW